MRAAAALEPNTVVAGKFRVIGRLGAGGMGVVYEAEHVDLAQRVAIKVISGASEDARDREVIERFRREALVMAKLESDNAVRVYDYGTLPDGAPYLVMEFLKGTDLSIYLRKQGPMHVAEAAEIGVAACSALTEAHGKGIVHRDLKPANLFLVDRPGGKHIVKLLDFGISLFREAGVDPITGTSAGIGTPLYAAPELFTSPRTADARADIWSLGASLYELVTGHVPFPAANLGELAQKLRTPAPRASSLNRDVPEAFSDLLAACLERDVSKRPLTAAALGTALERFRVLNQSSLLFGGRMDENLRAAFALTESAPPAPAPTALSQTTPVVILAKTAAATGRAHPTHVSPSKSPTRSLLWLLPLAIAGLAGLSALAYFGITMQSRDRASGTAPPAQNSAPPEQTRVVVSPAPLAPMTSGAASSPLVAPSPASSVRRTPKGQHARPGGDNKNPFTNYD